MHRLKKLINKLRSSPKPQPKRGDAPRRLKKAHYKTFKLSKKLTSDQPPLPKARKILTRSILQIQQQWKPILFATVVYGVLLFVFVRGIKGGVDLATIKDSLSQLTNGTSLLASSVALFGIVVSSSGGSDPAASLYQTVLLIIMSLAYIWLLRHAWEKGSKKVTARQAFYKGMYPLIPFMLITAVMSLQMLPMAVGSIVYNMVIVSGLAIGALEKTLWFILIGLLILLSIYMLTSSLFALYIVTLPDMTPIKALRSARELVRYRRWTVMRKVLFLPVVLLVLAVVITLPFIAFFPAAAQWVFFVETIVALPIFHSYMYGLYRDLL